MTPCFVQPKTYSFEEHQIPQERIDEHALYVIEKLKLAGHQAYLVGGGVRDLLLNQRPKDFDVSTSAEPEEIRALFRNALLIGRRFRLAHIRFGKKVIEVATFRAGDPESADLIVRDNVWGTEEEDVLRRDFTINGLFYDPQNQVVIDYVGGFCDIEKRMLRSIGLPEVRFMQDPVRMIRLLKFCARFDLKIDKATHEALLHCRHHILHSSSVRILEELLRMLESGASAPFFKLLYQYGLLKKLIPPLAHFIELDQEERIFKILEEVDSEMRKNRGDSLDRSLPLSALCFPVFDLTVRHLITEKGKIPHLGQITYEAEQLITNLFSPFFRIPRRLKGMMTFILATQYRFTPLDGKTARRRRLPRNESLKDSLHLFKIRSALDPELVPLYTSWTEFLFAHPTESRPLVKRTRRRQSPPETPLS